MTRKVKMQLTSWRWMKFYPKHVFSEKTGSLQKNYFLSAGSTETLLIYSNFVAVINKLDDTILWIGSFRNIKFQLNKNNRKVNKLCYSISFTCVLLASLLSWIQFNCQIQGLFPLQTQKLELPLIRQSKFKKLQTLSQTIITFIWPNSIWFRLFKWSANLLELAMSTSNKNNVFTPTEKKKLPTRPFFMNKDQNCLNSINVQATNRDGTQPESALHFPELTGQYVNWMNQFEGLVLQNLEK